MEPRAFLLALSVLLVPAAAEILTPPYFNLALGKMITATATCGDEGPELYCKLAGANADQDEHVIQGQVCDICDVNTEAKAHPPDYAVDGLETWWQSPPLSRAMKYNEVNLTIDLGQEFHVAYVFVRMGNSPRPGVWALEKSTDYGKTYKPWQYFADSPQDCERYFGKKSLQPITQDDSVICSIEYSKIVPLEGGEIPISLLNYRPSANKYFNSSVLQEWTRATNVRLRFIRTKNLLGHLMSVARKDPTVTRRYFYSIKDISIGGRCMCNGHADTCEPSDPESPADILVCRCQHNTCGPQCAKCCTGFEQKKWRISQNWDRFECEPCNCHNHTTECIFDPEVDEKRLSLDIHGRYEGGGVCKNCQHNTEGINCNKCRPKFFRPYGKRWDEIDVCRPCTCDSRFSTGNCAEESGRCECRPEFQSPHCASCAYGYFDYPNCKPCTCNLNGTEGEHCTPTGGQCPCKYNYNGTKCEICADGFYSPACKNCECNSHASASPVCDKQSGNCTCLSKFAGRTCNKCDAGHYDYPTCNKCNCDTSGTEPKICDDVSGECICRTGFGGVRCDQCMPGYYMEVMGRERVCVPCNCSAKGSTSTSCSSSGKCNCLSSFGGKQCDQCSPGYYKYPECLSCNCDAAGSIGASCDDVGQCNCRKNFDGPQCAHCKEQFYNYPACEECNCDPRGVISSFAGCGSVPPGELCQCKSRVQGRICNDCKPLFWNLQEYNPYGCDECKCNLTGTLGGLGTCDTRTGQCVCKLHVDEKKCGQCKDGFYSLDATNMFGCSDCGCDIGGAVDNSCDKVTGQCRCHSRIEGRRCDRPLQAHYFPTLHQFQYEVEEGLTPSGPVRFRSAEDVFPQYSWKGYVIFNLLQNEVINIVHISKPSLYRMVLRYVSLIRDPVVATIIITPESVIDIQQKFTVLLKPSSIPTFVTVAGEKGSAPAPLVMDPGNWTVTIKINKEVFIDYFVLLPAAYYEATVLTKLVDKPCTIGENSLCRHFAYPSLSGFPTAKIHNAVKFYLNDPEQLQELNAIHGDIPLLSNMQKELNYSIEFKEPGPYVLLIEYVTPIDRTDLTRSRHDERLAGGTAHLFDISVKGTVIVRMQSKDGGSVYGLAYLNDCPYTSACRVAVVDVQAKLQVGLSRGTNELFTLSGERDTLAGIKSVVAIPESDWHLDYLTPRPYCLRREGECASAVFSAAVDSKKIELETGSGGDRTTRLPPILDNSTAVVYLDPHSKALTIDSKIPAQGDYIFVVHYYQPDHPESYIEAMVTGAGKNYSSKLIVEHCPSNSGCRALLRQADDTYRFPLRDNFTLTFKTAPKGVWLDYILVIKAGDYVNGVLKETNLLDYTQEFINKCGANNYYINTTEIGFCRDAVFSITADYNSGTLYCHCAYEGSTDLECEKFGGQCKCKPNVIGRTCSACRAGYYGYPDCRPCHCPSTAICDEYGMCICPNNVEGENCDRCKPFTFNFDVQRGCDDCNCSPLGVVDGQLQCDLDDGSCHCKHNVIGRTCDHCVPGHYGFPYCNPCHCTLAGTTDDVCDQNNAQCYCKKHVRGQACDTCKEEYYNLQASNPDGCTKCYCFGKTTRCTKSDYVWASIVGMENWYLVTIEFNRTLNIFPLSELPNTLNASAIGVQLNTKEVQNKVVYFGAPSHFLGKRLTSYGGYLRYSILYTINEYEYGNAIAAADIILGGANGFIVYTSVEQPPAVEPWYHAVRLTEEDFTNTDGSAVTRDQFMNTLVNLTAIYIRATYWNTAVTTRLLGVNLDVAVEADDWIETPERASSVEHCLCPMAYRGSSCEQCAEGHYRLSSGSYAGFCVPCQCNGHSNTCDVNTGICLGCGDNTMGDHCEMCVTGYHGNATAGTPYDCLICACPLPIASNNFAVGCEVSSNGSLISCQCTVGYDGARCNFCAAGYYGSPEVAGRYCQPCNCSGNIDVHDPGSCDSITGDCLKCVNNTAGAACNLCAHGFYGDAVLYKNCTACSCNSYGMERCDPTTGRCVCRPGVLGERCDYCAPNHWGLLTGDGCSPCDCELASEAAQCDPDSGQCKCAKGVTGKHCDVCAAGYWNYTKDGCDHCNCNTGYSVGFMCNTQTGQCECLPGVVGEKCDSCPYRNVLIPNEGCLECDSCTDALLTTVQGLYYWLTNETQDFQDKADSFFTTQRLHYVMSQTQELRPRVAALRGVELQNVTRAITTLENRAKSAFRSAEFASTDSEVQTERAAALAENSDAVLAGVRGSGARAVDVVKHVIDLAAGLELSQQPKVDSALAEANEIKRHIGNISLISKHKSAEIVSKNATKQMQRMNIFVLPVTNQNKRFEVLRNNTHELRSKLDDVLRYKNLAQRAADDAETHNSNNRASKFSEKIMLVNQQNTAALEDLIDTAYMISNVTSLLIQSQHVANRTRKDYDDMIVTNQEIEYRIQQFAKDLPEFNKLLDRATHHATILSNRASLMKQLAERVSNNSRTQDAYSAASAYSSIVQEINEAKRESNDAERTLHNAIKLNASLAQRVGPAYERAGTLRDRAAHSLDAVQKDLDPRLSLAERALASAQNTHRAADDALSAIQMAIPVVYPLSLDEQINQADRVNSSVKNTREIMTGLGKDVAASREAAQTLPKIADEADKMTLNVHNLESNIRDTLPNVSKVFKSIMSMQFNIEDSMRTPDEKTQKLRNLIEQARTVANRISVGVTFDTSSTLQPHLPDTIDEMSTSTHVSAYFRTKKKNGLLLYLGNPKGTNLRRTKSDDFMILEIKQGYPNLLIDIGDGHDSSRSPVRIGHPKYVADDRWYQIIVDRVERNVKFTIRESTDDGRAMPIEKDVTIPGEYTIFNLDKKKSKLYVGGIPSGSGVQDISYPAFEGQIEELMIGDSPVGLWNFVSAENLKGARQRDKLITSQLSPEEYRFNGQAYVTVPARKYLQPDKNHIQLFFRTYAPNGLIYLVGDKNYFFSIQMQEGRVYLQFCLGNPQDLVIIGTTKTYNDGKWHKLEAARRYSVSSLRLDNEPQLKQEALGLQVTMPVVETMNFGGNNLGIPQITSAGFDGCIRHVKIDSTNVDLSQNSESIGVTNTCQFASLVSLSASDSYICYGNITSENFKMTLKFKTSSSDGLLFVFFNRVQDMKADSISLALVNGRLVLMSQREKLDSGLSTYNDSQWHVVTATHSNALKFVVDDFDKFSTDTPPPPLHILDGVLFVGGLQPNYVVSMKVGTRSPFAGCLADANLNGRPLNLLMPYSYRSVTFGRCGDTTSTGASSTDQTWVHTDSPSVLPMPTHGSTPPSEITTSVARPNNAFVSAQSTAPPTTHWTPARPSSVEYTPAPATTLTPVAAVATTTKRPAPSPKDGCALSFNTSYMIGDPTVGYRFGTRQDSRIEYGQLPGRQLEGYDLSVGFRTSDVNGGLIFYASQDQNNAQFLALYMQQGYLYAAFNCGGDTAHVRSQATYADGHWHTLTFSRTGGSGKLSADNEMVGEATTKCLMPAALAPPFFYGGLGNATKDILSNLKGFYQPFKGCLRRLELNGQPVTEERRRSSAPLCSDNVEEGVYFAPSGGYLRLHENYKVGHEISISMEIKPRNTSGLLMCVYGRRDFLVLELIEDEVLVNVENGRGPFHTSFKLNYKYALCDGQWHKIYVVKSRHVVSVGVDGHFSKAGLGMSSSTDTRSAIYVGGHERPISKLRGVTSKRGYFGCMRNLVIKQAAVPIPLTAAHGGVHVGYCPAD